jgi:hypothetical protein
MRTVIFSRKEEEEEEEEEACRWLKLSNGQ